MTYLPKSLADQWDGERITSETDPAINALEAQRLAAQGSARPPQLAPIGGAPEPMPQMQAPVEDNTPVDWGQAVPTMADLGYPDAPPAGPQQPMSTPTGQSGTAMPMPTASGATSFSGGSGMTGDKASVIRAAAAQYGVNPDIFDRQLNQEGAYADDVWNGGRNSSAGARGPGQFMTPTGNSVADQMGIPRDQFWASPELQVQGAAFHMAQLLKANGGDYARALAAYNAGQGAVNQYGGVPPYDETQTYVRNILNGQNPSAGIRDIPNATPSMGTIRDIPNERSDTPDPGFTNLGSAAMLADNAPVGSPDVLGASDGSQASIQSQNGGIGSPGNATIKGMPVADALRLGGQFQLGGPDDVSGGLAGASQGADGSSGDNVSGGYSPVQAISNGDGTPLDAGGNGYVAGRDAATGFPSQAANGGGNPPVRDNAWASGDLSQPVASGSTWQDTAEQPDWSASPPSGAQADPGAGAPPPAPVEQPQTPIDRFVGGLKDLITSLLPGGDQNTAPEAPQRPATPENFNLGAAESRAQNADSVAGLSERAGWVADSVANTYEPVGGTFPDAQYPINTPQGIAERAGQIALRSVSGQISEQDAQEEQRLADSGPLGAALVNTNRALRAARGGAFASASVIPNVVNDTVIPEQFSRENLHDPVLGLGIADVLPQPNALGVGLGRAGSQAPNLLERAGGRIGQEIGKMNPFPKRGTVPEMASGVVSGADNAGQYRVIGSLDDAKTGEPVALRAWHGSPSPDAIRNEGFKVPDSERNPLSEPIQSKLGREGWLDKGVYFTDKKNYASQYGVPQSVEVVLDNPYVISHATLADIQRLDINALKEAGHDGIIIQQGRYGQNGETYRQGVVFDPSKARVSDEPFRPTDFVKGAEVVNPETGQKGIVQGIRPLGEQYRQYHPEGVTAYLDVAWKKNKDFPARRDGNVYDTTVELTGGGKQPQFMPSPPAPRGSGQAVDEAMVRMGTNALQGGVAGAVGEAQNDPNATPATIGKAALMGATQRVLLGNARGVLGPRNAGTIARAVKDATNRYAESGSPELERLGAMRNTPPPTVGDMPQAAGRAQQLARNLAQKLTDSNSTMDNLQKDVLKAPLPIEEKVSALQRLNPESAVDIQIQREIMGPLREAGLEGRKDAADIMALEQNIVQAENIGKRVERDFRLPTVDRRETELANLQAEAARIEAQGGKASVDLTSRIERAQAAVDEAKAYIEPAEAKAKADKLREQADTTAQKAADQFNSPARVRVESEVRRLEAQAARETRAQGAPNEGTFNALEDARGRLATEQQAEDVARQQIAETERLRVEEQARRLEDQYASPKVAKAQARLDDEMAKADQEIRRQGRRSATAERRIAAAQQALDDERMAEQVAAQQAGQTARDTRAFSGGLNASDSRKALADLEQYLGPEKYAQARKLAQTIWDFNDGTLAIKEAAHIVPAETAARLRETNAVYSPTNIIKYSSADSASGGVPIGKKIGLSDNGLKRLSEEGTTAAKQDDIEASIAARYDAMRMAHKNTITEKFLDAAKANPELNQHVREIITREQWQQQGRQLLDGQVLDPGRLETGQTRIGWFDKDAVKHEYLVDDWAKPLIEGARVPDMTAYEKFLQEWKGSVTDRSLSFTIRNAPRDFIGVTRNMMVNEGGVYPKQIKQVIVDLANGYRDAFKGIRDGTFHGSTADYLESGGGYQRSSGRGLEGERQRVDDIARTGGLEIKNPLDFYHWYTDPLSELNKRLELGPRSARFRQEMRLSEGNDVQSVIAARDLMAYEVAGDWTRTMNRWIPFLSARVAGSMSDVRLAKTNPKAYLAASIMTGVIPAFAQELYNRADPDRSKAYDDVPPYLKYMGNVIMLPWAGKDTYGMPLPNYLFLPTGVVTPWAILGHGLGDAVMGKGAAPSDYAEALDGLIGSMAPVDTAVGGVASNILGPVGSAAVGMATNKDLFRGNEISTRQSDIEASRLSQLGTQAVNAGLSKVPVVGPGMANQSPAMWDYQIKNALGYPGQAILGASDTGRDRPGDASNVQDLPVIGGLVSPLVGNRSGGVFTQESARIMSGRAGQEIRDSGVKWEPQPVDAKIGNVPLTRTERGEVQREANKLFNEYAADVRRMDPKWDTYDAKTREGLLKNLYKSATQGAEAQLLQRYPERFGKDAIKAQERRIEIVQEKKAG